ncbi:DDB1- and CUL4-associated factor 1-like isoform X2 [Tigriopus californicus]|uniref:DDB1- and CUL4-associated factor 1-like isoform X2 n=1 Tax=Tigriopus californicus TaxID=6832 RepID=UPI0027DA8B8D|nr:DDB1- and CUL4-associated factor 1-like isoform X2 [Tigriopus californicus]
MASSGSSSDSSASDSSQMDDPSLDPRLLARTQPDPETEAHLEAFQAAVRAWEEAKSQPPFDPTGHILQMVTLFEKASGSYFARDPDPFEVRHPSRVIPECALGQLLKIYFKKESLVQDLLNSYMRDNYWTRTGQTKDAFDLNVAACRLIIAITPGLELSVLSNTDGLISQLFRWVDKAAEPLLSYATVVLASAMEITAVATEPDNREKSFKLVPTLVKRMRAHILESQTAQESFKRPFVHLGSQSTSQPLGRGVKRKSTDTGEGEAEKSQSGLASPSTHQNGDWSNSSWTEVESQILGQFSFHPLDTTGKMVAILRFLTPLAEYQEFLAHIHELNGVQDIFDWCLNMRDTKNARLAFEALKFLTALFCHKKFVTEWVNKDHIQQLLSIPRPSIASTAVSQCLFYLSCDDDSMEKVCLMPEHLQIRLVKYVLWLMECSHDTGRQFGVMFFGMSAAFRKLLELYDKEGGQRKVFNTISTLRVLNPDDDDMLILTDDEEYTQRQKLRHAMVALKKYFEAHLALKCEQLKRSMGYDPAQSPQPVIVSYKPIRLTSEQVYERVSSLMKHMPFRSRWGPVDEFINLDGVSTCLQIIAMAYDWTFTGRSEMVRCALDVLAICCVVPKVQLQLCERIELYDETKTVGINIVLGAAEGDIVQDSADVRKSALTLIINCVCAPINRPGIQTRHALNSSTVTTTPASHRRKAIGKSSEDLINKVWDCCRSNNGIMALLELLSIKTPITDADAIRALACKALVGLARSDAAKQIMSKLPIFINGQLQQLVREPILQDKRTEHYKFQQYAHELMEIVSTGEGQVHRLARGNDFSVEMLHRASVVAQTKIRFSKKQLLQLIQEYLASEGLSDSAAVLQREANIAVLNAPSNRSLIHRSVNNTPNPLVTPTTPHRPLSSTSSLNRALASPPASSSMNRSLFDAPGTPSSPPSSGVKPSESSAVSTPNIPIRINRNRGGRHDTPIVGLGTPASSSKNIQRACEPFSLPNASEFNQGTSEKKVTLVSIVSDYLFSQHSLCKNPMTTCPEFDLLIPHKCPDPRPKNAAPMNFSLRHSRKEVWPPFGGPEGGKLDRQLIYSRFKPSKSFKLEPRDENTSTTFSSCAFMPDDSFLLAGTSTGDVKMFNMATGSEEGSFACHQTILFHLQPNREGKLLLTSSAWRIPYSGLWSLGEFFENKMNFNHDEYVEFSNVHQDKVIGTKGEKAKIYDINTQKVIMELNPAISNNYSMNRATFDPFDDLILNDGVLFDSRSGKEIRKLDKLNQTLSGVFHPNGLEIISNTEVWDLRTFHLLKTVPGLDQCTVKFSNSGNIIYAVTMQEEEPDGEEKFESAFRTFDASDYSSIATIETRRAVVDLATSHFDLQLAVVENSNIPTHEESVVRLYDVGQIRSEEDEAEDDDNDGDEGDEDDSDDGDDDDDDEDDYDDEDDDDDDDEDMIMLDEDDDGNEDNAEPEAGPQEPAVAALEEQQVANGQEGDTDNPVEIESDDGSWEDVDEEVSIG